MSHIFLALLAVICALFFSAAAFAHHRPAGLFGYPHERISFVGMAFGLVLALVQGAVIVGISSIVLVPFFAVAALMLLTAALGPKLKSMSKPTSNLVAYYGNCVGIAGLVCAVIFHLSTGEPFIAVCAALAFTTGCFMLVRLGLKSSLPVSATPA